MTFRSGQVVHPPDVHFKLVLDASILGVHLKVPSCPWDPLGWRGDGPAG
jgi:hypothetical protein